MAADIKEEPVALINDDTNVPTCVSGSDNPIGVEHCTKATENNLAEVIIKIEPNDAVGEVLNIEYDPGNVVENVRSPDVVTVKQEMDIGLTVLQPPDVHYTPRLSKSEPADKTPQVHHKGKNELNSIHHMDEDSEDVTTATLNSRRLMQSKTERGHKDSGRVDRNEHSCEHDGCESTCGTVGNLKTHLKKHQDIVHQSVCHNIATFKEESYDANYGDESEQVKNERSVLYHRTRGTENNQADVKLKSDPSDVNGECITAEDADVDVVEDVRSPVMAPVKQELDFGLTVLQPSDSHFMPQPCKPEPADEPPQANHMPHLRNQYSAGEKHEIHSKTTENKQAHTHGCVHCSQYINQINHDSDLSQSNNVCNESEKLYVCSTQKSHWYGHSSKKHADELPYSYKLCSNSHAHECQLTQCNTNINFDGNPSLSDRKRYYSCDICSKSFPGRNHLDKHMKIHNGYSCDGCDKKFTQITSLTRHKKIHSGKHSYSCDVCEKSFTRKYDLVNHTNLHAGKRPYSCDVCGKSFTQKFNLARHKNSHSSEFPYTCDVCNKSFTRKNCFVNHKNIHADKRPYSCDVCGKSFTRKLNLTQHKNIHAGKRPYSCDKCSKSFRHRNGLAEHRNIHTGIRPYNCDICKKSFTRKYGLVIHINKHSCKSQYSCDTCGKGFAQKYNLNRHMIIHGVKHAYSCDV